MTDDQPDAPFLLLCAKDRRHLYQNLLCNLDYKIEGYVDIDLLLRAAIETPPLAVVIDTVTSMRVGPKRMWPLFAVGKAWPVVRCAINDVGQASVVCVDPPMRCTLREALDRFVKSTEATEPAHRKQIRFDANTRVRFRVEHDSLWIEGILMNLSAGGALVASDAAPEPGTNIELLLDGRNAELVGLKGVVAWEGANEQSGGLPAFGVSFDIKQASKIVSKTLAYLQIKGNAAPTEPSSE